MMPAAAAHYRLARVGGCLAATVQRREDGCTLLRSTEALGAVPATLNECLLHWAHEAPERTLAAQRDTTGAWRHISYAQMLQRAQAVGQALLDRGASLQRPLAILSDNDLEHLTLSLGAMWAGVPWVPVSPAYSLLSQDFGKLRHIFGVTTPGLVFAADARYAAAIDAVVAAEVPVVLGRGALAGRSTVSVDDLLATPITPALAQAHARIGPDSIAKFLFTSGSTKEPKAVINTHRMLCSNQQMLRQAMAFLADTPPVLVDWLPWNHTFGGNHNIGICLYNGGTLYIDEGKPTASGINTTLHNLREIAPTVYFNVPKGFDELTRACEHDALLRETLFSRVQAFMFAGATLSQAVWDRLDALAEQTLGARVPMITGLGMTETAPSCTFSLVPGKPAGHIGLPCPGVEVKLVPGVGSAEGKTEIRFRGPNVTPGYWRAPELTAAAFDEEGFYRTGDAVRFQDEDDPQQGLMFDGRIAEDFKLSSGSFVSVGPLRAKVIAAGDPLVQDAVVAGLNRDDIGLLIFVRWDDARVQFGLPASLSVAQLSADAAVRRHFQQMLDALWDEGTGSATRVARLLLLEEPPQIDRGELTDKGSINQGAVLKHRAQSVERLYAASDASVLTPKTR
jgi:feruloyl-CoA synthase